MGKLKVSFASTRASLHAGADEASASLQSGTGASLRRHAPLSSHQRMTSNGSPFDVGSHGWLGQDSAPSHAITVPANATAKHEKRQVDAIAPVALLHAPM